MKRGEREKQGRARRTDRERKKQFLVWLVTVVFSVVLLLAAHAAVSRDSEIFGLGESYTVRAVVTEMGDLQTSSYEAGTLYEDSTQLFYARITSGPQKGETVLAAQSFDNYTAYNADEPVSVGDHIILYNYGTEINGTSFVMGGYERLVPNLVFLAVFFLLLVLFGQWKGVNTIVSLSFTCLAVFAVFIPSVLAGYNIYAMACLTCVYTIVMTLLITNGATDKSLTTILGCSFGVAVAALLSVIMDRVLRLTGILDEHSIYLQTLGTGVTINLRALIFAMVVIGAMGAVMDVAMDISSALYELHIQAPNLRFRELILSGLRIGRDVMGTMANTLVLAYIGSNLCSILLLITYSSSLLELLNRENIAVEIMQSLIGSTAILLTIPLTSIVCALLYVGRDQKRKAPGRRGARRKALKTEAPAAEMPAAETAEHAETEFVAKTEMEEQAVAGNAASDAAAPERDKPETEKDEPAREQENPDQKRAEPARREEESERDAEPDYAALAAFLKEDIREEGKRRSDF